MNNTVKRSIFGVLFLAVMLGGLLFNKTLYTVLFAFITFVMLGEFYRMTMGKAYKTLQETASMMGAILFYFCAQQVFKEEPLVEELGVAMLILLIVMIESLFYKDHTDFLKTGYIYAGFVYIALPLCLSPMVVYWNGAFTGMLMLAFFIIIWASDVGAYCFGMLLGQKIWPAKLCPSISPKKSWAGYIGGLVTALLAGLVLHWTNLVWFPLHHCLIMAAIMHVMGVFGDLFESMWKRAAGIKDSGNIIPGHGGLLDRFDSALFAIPAGYLYLLIFNLV